MQVSRGAGLPRIVALVAPLDTPLDKLGATRDANLHWVERIFKELFWVYLIDILTETAKISVSVLTNQSLRTDIGLELMTTNCQLTGSRLY